MRGAGPCPAAAPWAAPQLDQLLEKARVEQWTRLHLRSPGYGWPPDTTAVDQITPSQIESLSRITSLQDLAIVGLTIGAEGARAILDAWTARASPNPTFLELSGNGDLASLLPPEALNTSDAQAILAAYRRQTIAARQGDLRPLNQAKLLVLGDEAVGKTSLIRYLIHNRPRDPDEKATPRAQIHERIDIQPWSPLSGDVFLNVWDFGGQEIMRGTHQFFLTHRSLYVIVLEDRRHDDESAVYKWLRMVQTRGGDSPVLIVINKSDTPSPASASTKPLSSATIPSPAYSAPPATTITGPAKVSKP